MRADPVRQATGSTPPRHRCSSTPPAPRRTPAPCAPRRWPGRSPPPSARRSRRTAAPRPGAPAAWSATAGPPRPGRARTSGCTGSRPGWWPGTRPTAASASRQAGAAPGAPRPSRAPPCAAARPSPRRRRTAAPPAPRPSASPATARPAQPRPPGPGTAAPCCAPPPPQRAIARSEAPASYFSRRISRTRRIDTLSAGIPVPPRVQREGGPGPAQRSSNHPPPKGVADFRSEWPTSSRNHRPTSNRNRWPTCSGIRTSSSRPIAIRRRNAASRSSCRARRCSADNLNFVDGCGGTSVTTITRPFHSQIGAACPLHLGDLVSVEGGPSGVSPALSYRLGTCFPCDTESRPVATPPWQPHGYSA